jgi:transcriptional regulator of acetoin/glycerol metabolism
LSNAPGETTEIRYRATSDLDNEREAIVAAMAETDGALARAADLLGMSRTTLWRKLKALGLTSAPSTEGDTARH